MADPLVTVDISGLFIGAYDTSSQGPAPSTDLVIKKEI